MLRHASSNSRFLDSVGDDCNCTFAVLSFFFITLTLSIITSIKKPTTIHTKSAMSASSSRASVKAGSCMVGGDSTLCALQGSDCPAATEWVAPRQLPTSNAHGGSCKSKDGTEVIAKVGLCGSSEVCASDASVCGGNTIENAFEPFVETCTMKSPSVQFAKCNDACYWSSDDCDGTKLTTGAENDCTCEEVRVGACLFDGHSHPALVPRTTSGYPPRIFQPRRRNVSCVAFPPHRLQM